MWGRTDTARRAGQSSLGVTSRRTTGCAPTVRWSRSFCQTAVAIASRGSTTRPSTRSGVSRGSRTARAPPTLGHRALGARVSTVSTSSRGRKSASATTRGGCATLVPRSTRNSAVGVGPMSTCGQTTRIAASATSRTTETSSRQRLATLHFSPCGTRLPRLRIASRRI
jgi:hypothetical protein